jgi:hypothetical protein
MDQIQGQITGRKVIDGRALARWCSRASQFTRICIGAAIKNGELNPAHFTTAQIAKLVRVKARDINAVAALPPEQRALANGKRRNEQVMTDATLDELVVHVGVGKVMAALDRLTKPAVIAAE